MFSEMIAHMRNYITLTEEEVTLLTTALEIKEVKKKEHLLKAGEVCCDNYFVLNGCFRLYLITCRGAEQTIQFGIENWWITDYMSLRAGKPSGFYLQATEDAKIVVLNKDVQEELFVKIPQLERYFRLVLERAYSAQLTRIHYIFSYTGEKQYRVMNRDFPEFVKRIPQYMLASFLGMTPEFLSRLRAKKK
ncbi:Crp/Fnr family transcriptional regulator [Flavobacterium arcticum]|uniref:Crp/Fnr family transcriptional regulator n=1 Tax=Flavobacterium arcticum TaxID=1784713 RepID=A0A345HC78_9FLAO|nr:Crp/Fnr family transcriptional regulator [Flavobacterium arcticum]AXG74188.1 Crp/Fnr family transcriptional regulator [Flavobacterium arcticum]KAF2508224.1 Crp/Fnr family transcriptional regulator [Flavobacterium arcticum]